MKAVSCQRNKESTNPEKKAAIKIELQILAFKETLRLVVHFADQARLNLVQQRTKDLAILQSICKRRFNFFASDCFDPFLRLRLCCRIVLCFHLCAS